MKLDKNDNKKKRFEMFTPLTVNLIPMDIVINKTKKYIFGRYLLVTIHVASFSDKITPSRINYHL